MIPSWIYLGGRECKQTWRKAKYNVVARLKQLKIPKRKVELKTWKCKAEGRCAWDDFTLRKTRRMQIRVHVIGVQLQISVPKQTYIFLPLVFYKMPDQGSSWSYLCTKAHNNLHVSSKFKVAARLVPQNDPINARVLSLGPRLSLFPK